VKEIYLVVQEGIRMDEGNDLMTRIQAAAYLGVKVNTLAVWATTGRYNLPCYKVGRLVKYRRSDLDAFIASRRVGGMAA
jgi:excisionase family DNA binding protein